jgi:hypothetical protein
MSELEAANLSTAPARLPGFGGEAECLRLLHS